MLPIVFPNATGPNGGPASDGVLAGVLARVPPVTALSQVHLIPSTQVFRGNADTAGGLTWSNVTTAANNDVAGDVSIFDTANPAADMICLDLASGDEVNGISLLVSTAAVLAGAPAAEVRYRTATGWATATGVVTPALTSTGLKKVAFDTVKYSDIAPIDHLIDPFTQPQMRCVFLRFTGITVTTPALFTRVWKNINHGAAHKFVNFTSVVSQGANPDFSGAQASVLPVQADLTLYGWDEIPLRLFVTRFRPSAVPASQKEWVYCKSDGSFVAWPAANIVDPTNQLSAALTQSAAINASRNLASTYTGGAWGNSALSSTTQLVGDGYVEFKVGATPSLGGFIGFNDAAGGASYTDIDWAYHIGHAATAFASAFVNGGQQTASGTWAIATGDILRLERRGGVFRLFQNGTLRHTFATTSTAAVVVDTAFISLGGVNDLVLVSYNTGIVPITWGTPTQVTESAGANVAIDLIAEARISLVPPSDLGKSSLTDTADAAHNRYWIGHRQTADVSSAILPANFTLQAQVAKGAGNQGIPSPDAGTYTKATIWAADQSPSAATFLAVNVTTGKVADFSIGANDPLGTSVIFLPVMEGDECVIVQPFGDPAVNIGDGGIYLNK